MPRSSPTCRRSPSRPRPALVSAPARGTAGAGLPAALALCLLLAPPARPGPDRTERLIAGAKKEGSLALYRSLTVDDMQAFGGAFEKKYGIKINLWRSSSEDILQRAVMEAHGGRFDVDAVETSAAEMESFRREKLLQEVQSPYLAELSRAALLPHCEWVGARLNFITAAYNTNRVRKADLPQSYDDLLDPRWKGKLTIGGEDSVWFGAVISALGEEKGSLSFARLPAATAFRPTRAVRSSPTWSPPARCRSRSRPNDVAPNNIRSSRSMFSSR
jgi:iron(III) transport system substrate-binding protein